MTQVQHSCLSRGDPFAPPVRAGKRFGSRSPAVDLILSSVSNRSSVDALWLSADMRLTKLAVVVASGVTLAGVAGAWGYLHFKRSRPLTRSALVPPVLPSGTAERLRARCERGSLNLTFYFQDREAPWQRGRRYELELSLDGRISVCSFAVPADRSSYWWRKGRMPTTSECSLSVWSSGEPAGISVSGRPSHVRVRILSEGAVFYRGEVFPKYDSPSAGCFFDNQVVLSAETGGD
jgi:hypothetical protein